LVVTREPTEDAMSENPKRSWNRTDRRSFIGGSDARIIMAERASAAKLAAIPAGASPADIGVQSMS
jgi:hypothetical protein